MTILGYIQLSIEVIALITSIIFFRYFPSKKWLLWIPFLLYTCIVEIYSSYLAHVKNEDNLWVYNPYIIVFLLFYGWFIIHISILNVKLKKKLYLTIAIFTIISITWYMIWGSSEDLISPILNIGCFIICLLCLLFYYTQIRNPAHHDSLTSVPGFWMVSGILIFHSGILLYTVVYDLLARIQPTIMNITVQNLIPQILSLFLYTAIIVDIIQCRHRAKTY